MTPLHLATTMDMETQEYEDEDDGDTYQHGRDGYGANDVITRGTKKTKSSSKFITESKAFDLLSIVQKLVQANPEVLINSRDTDGDTPFQARLAHLKDPSLERHDIIEGDPVLCYLREYIITNFSRRDAMTALCKIGEVEITPCFNVVRADLKPGAKPKGLGCVRTSARV